MNFTNPSGRNTCRCILPAYASVSLLTGHNETGAPQDSPHAHTWQHRRSAGHDADMDLPLRIRQPVPEKDTRVVAFPTRVVVCKNEDLSSRLIVAVSVTTGAGGGSSLSLITGVDSKAGASCPEVQTAVASCPRRCSVCGRRSRR